MIKLNYVIYLSVVTLIYTIPTINVANGQNQLDAISVSSIINTPTDSIFILDVIKLSGNFTIPDKRIKELQHVVNIKNTTKTFQSIYSLYTNRSILSISDYEIDKILSSYIGYHNIIYGDMSEELYFETATQLKEIGDISIEKYIAKIIYELINDIKTLDKKKTLSRIQKLLPLKDTTSNLSLLYNLSPIVTNTQMFELMDEIEKENPQNIDLINGMKQYKNNILNPNKSPEWHVVH